MFVVCILHTNFMFVCHRDIFSTVRVCICRDSEIKCLCVYFLLSLINVFLFVSIIFSLPKCLYFVLLI